MSIIAWYHRRNKPTSVSESTPKTSPPPPPPLDRQLGVHSLNTNMEHSRIPVYLKKGIDEGAMQAIKYVRPHQQVDCFKLKGSEDEYKKHATDLSKKHVISRFFVICDGLVANNGKSYYIIYYKRKPEGDWNDAARLLATADHLQTIAIISVVGNRTAEELEEETKYWSDGILGYDWD
ncbi:hypothetical protein BGZ46_009406 [Entomortierella lignicola]|nr:hypothetical protein BGZ46_009406 [Entomortierella lignicola]